MACAYCGSKRHPTGLCPKTAGGQANRRALRCGYCGGRNHDESACPKLMKPHRMNRDGMFMD